MFTRIELEVGFIVEPQIRHYCGPLFFARSLNSAPGNVIASGSFGLVDTGKKKLLVTCHHVWEEFGAAHRRDSETMLCVCLDKGPPVVLQPDLLIDSDGELDIATFDAEPLLPACSGRTFYPLSHESAPHVRSGDRIAFVGYPGAYRATSEDGVRFGFRMYAVNVSDLNDRHLVADLSRARTVDYEQAAVPENGSLHGGISGSPCFLVQEARPVKLVAFTTSEAMGILRFTRLRRLNPDGRLGR